MIIFLTIFAAVFIVKADAASWYVDNDASGSNNGTSWANAWTALRNVVWGSGGVKAGDTLFISGGTTSKTYDITSTEYLGIGASGSSLSNPITIRIGQDASHNGVAILDGNNSYAGHIRFYNRNFITIDGEYNGARHIKLYNGSTAGGNNSLIDANTINGIKIRYLELEKGDNGIGLVYPNRSGLTANVCEIDHCYIHDIRQNSAIYMNGSALD
jgi:hypothetical protein